MAETGPGLEDVFPFPKTQFHEVGEPVERSVNWTNKGAQPLVTDPEKFAVTCAFILKETNKNRRKRYK